MGMASSLQQEFWEAVESADGARYTELSDALDLAPIARQERRPAVPLRVCLVPSKGTAPYQCGSSEIRGNCVLLEFYSIGLVVLSVNEVI